MKIDKHKESDDEIDEIEGSSEVTTEKKLPGRSYSRKKLSRWSHMHNFHVFVYKSILQMYSNNSFQVKATFPTLFLSQHVFVL